MGIKVEVTHAVELACDHAGCANGFHETVDDVTKAIAAARKQKWWVGKDFSVYHVAKRPLAYCPEHLADCPTLDEKAAANAR